MAAQYQRVFGQVLTFLRHPQPRPFAMFVEGVSQLRKNPVCRFVSFCAAKT
jgi:hypothetical protein